MKRALLWVLFVLNLLDTGLTLWGLSLGARELNPVMRFLLAGGAIPFTAAKVFLGSWVIWKAGQRKEVRLLTVWVIVLVYVGVIANNAWTLSVLATKGSP